MTQATTGDARPDGHQGEDFVCVICGCEVMVKHWGQLRPHTETSVFVCHCGGSMGPENATVRSGSETGGRAFDPEDFLGQGSGVGGPGASGPTSPSSHDEDR